MGPKVAADLQHPSASAVFTVATSGCNYVQAGGVSLPMKPGQQPFGTQPQSKFPDLPASCHQSHAECNLWEMVKCSSSLKEIHLHYCWSRFTLSTWKVPQLSWHGFVPEYLETAFPEAHLGSRKLASRISDYSSFPVQLERA